MSQYPLRRVLIGTVGSTSVLVVNVTNDVDVTVPNPASVAVLPVRTGSVVVTVVPLSMILDEAGVVPALIKAFGVSTLELICPMSTFVAVANKMVKDKQAATAHPNPLVPIVRKEFVSG